MPAKCVLVVRRDLNMRKGKIAAQCAHAAMKDLKTRWQAALDGIDRIERAAHRRDYTLDSGEALLNRQWR